MITEANCGVGQIPGFRAEQQDGFALGEAILAGRHAAALTVIADGMGGHVGGARAARIAIESFLQICGLGQAETFPELLDTALRGANRALDAERREHPELEGMGCTLVAAILDRGTLHYISVGDSILWRCGPSGLARINADHSMSPLLDASIRRGEITEEEAREHRSGLRSALTGGAIALIDGGSIDWNDEDAFLLATDGILTLAEEEIAAIIADSRGEGAASATHRRPNQSAVDNLLDRVEQRAPPDQDNCTIILVSTTSMVEGHDGAPSPIRRWTKSLLRPHVLLAVLGLALAGLSGVILAAGSMSWNQLKALI